MLKYKVEGKFMAQTYLATVITFAGLYFIIYRFDVRKILLSTFYKMKYIRDNINFFKYINLLTFT